MSFQPPKPLPAAEKPNPIELHPTGGVTEYVHPEYRDTVPKSGTEFDIESEHFFRALHDYHKLDYEEQDQLLKDFFHPYTTREKSFHQRLRDQKTAPRALELLRRLYIQCGFSTVAEDGAIQDQKRKSSYIDSGDFSPNYLSRWIVDSLAELDRELERTDLDERVLNRLKNNIFYVVSEAQNIGDSQARYKIDEWMRRHHDELDAVDPFFWESSDDSQDQIALYARRNFFINAEDGILAKQHLDSLMRLRAHAMELDISQEIDKQIFEPILSGRERDDYVFEQRREGLAQAMAAQYGLGFDIVDKWKDARVHLGNDNYRASYWENLKAAGKLELKHPGSVQQLYKEYGVANFGRYAPDMLLHQLEVADKDQKYGIVIYPEADYNGAFFQNEKQLYDMSLQLRVGGFETRIVEAGSQRELARRLLRLHKKYSPAGNNFSFAVVGGHGSPDSIALGDDRTVSPPPFPSSDKTQEEYEKELEMWRLTQATDTGSYTTEDFLEGEGINRALEEWFEKDAPKVLVSCSTGTEGGIAERVSTITSGEITAPKVPTNLKKIDVSFDEKGRPKFSVEYYKGETGRYVAGKSRE